MSALSFPGLYAVKYTLKSSPSNPSSNSTDLETYFAAALPWPLKCSLVVLLLIKLLYVSKLIGLTSTTGDTNLLFVSKTKFVDNFFVKSLLLL